MAVAIPFIASAIAPEALGAAAAVGGEAISWAGAGATASTFADIGTGASILGTGFQALGAYQTAQATKESDNYNSKIAQENSQIQTQNAKWAGEEGEEQAAQKEMETRSRVGSIEAAQGANGVDINSGSNLDVRSSAQELGELDALNIRANASRSAYGDETQAASSAAQSNLDKYAATQAGLSGDIGAGATLLTGGANTGLGYQKYLMNNSNTLSFD